MAMQARRCSRPALILALAALASTADARPDAWADACYVRPEPAAAADAAIRPPAGAQSSLGIRRTKTRLFDVALTVVGPNASVCSITGVARLRSGATGEMLVLPVRPDGGAATKGGASPCLVAVHATSDAFELTTSEPACQAQSLCGGQVALQGQRFDMASRVASQGGAPCFERPATRP